MARRRAFNAGGELISKTIDSVLQGVSQQPPTVRSSGQCEAQVNLQSDASSGAKHRAPTEHIAALDGLAFDGDAFTLPDKGYKVHLRDRDESTQHVVMIEDGDIRVFRIRDGVEANIQGATGTFDPDAFTAPQWITAIQGSSSTRSPQANSEADDDCELLRAAETASGCIWSADSPFSAVSVKVTTPGEGTYTLHWEYTIGTDGSQGEWAELTVRETAEEWKTAGIRTVSFDPPANWVAALAYGSVRLHVRCLYVAGDIDVNPLAGRVWIGYSGFDYLNIDGDDAATAFAVTSVADYSFIVNKEKVVELSADTTAARINQFMIHWIESGQEAAREWQHNLGEVTGAAGTNELAMPSANTDPGKMIAELIEDIYTGPLGSTYPLWKTGVKAGVNVLLVQQDDEELDGILSIEPPSYEYSDEVFAFIGLQTQRFSDLPAKAVDNFITEITGADGDEGNNYWVVYDSELNAWVETVAPGIQHAFDAGTMPHTLIQLESYSDSTPDVFSFSSQTWANREKGDLDSAPSPSFVGKTITDVFFHKNRLGLLADENVILSEAGEFFNFWSTTVTTIVDSDPIDAASTNNRVALLDHAVPFDHKLYMFSGHGAVQNVLQGGDTLTALSAEVTEASAYPSSTVVKPVASGKSIYFAVDRGVSSSVFDYTVTDNAADAWNLTAHIPTFVPANVTTMSLSPKEDILTMVSADEPYTLYVNSFNYNSRGEKVQNSWSKWEFHETYTILGQGWVGEILYLMVHRFDGLHLEKINVATLTEGALDYRVHLDSLVELTGVYTATDNKTRWTMPYYVNSVFGDYRVVMSGADHDDNLGKVIDLQYQAASNRILYTEGDYSAATAHIGRVYEWRYEFTKPVITAPDESGQKVVSVTQGRLQIARFKVLCKSAAGFSARVSSSEVNPNEVTVAEADYLYHFPGKILNASTVSPIHPCPVSEFRFDVAMESTYARIEIFGDSHLPFTLVGAEWEGVYSVRSSRV